MDSASLYREEIVTDRKVGTIRVMTPIKEDGAQDSGRDVIYIGEAQLMTSVGALPINFACPNLIQQAGGARTGISDAASPWSAAVAQA